MDIKQMIKSLIQRKWLRYALAGVMALALVALGVHQVWAASQRGAADDERLEASGIIQVESVSIASEFGGRVAAIPVTEGGAVGAGDLLIQLDTALLDARVEAAEAMVALAAAGLAQAQAGARPGQIAVAEAQLAQAEVGRAAAQQAVSDTLSLVENPQEIALQIAITQAQLEAARHQLAQASALRDGVGMAKDAFEEAYEEWNGGGRHTFRVASGSMNDLINQLPRELRSLIPEDAEVPSLDVGVYVVNGWELHVFTDRFELYKVINITFSMDAHLLPNSWWQAWVGVNAATAQAEGLEATLAHLYAQQEQPQEMEAAADEASGALAEVEAQIVAAQAQVDAMRAGATAEQIAALEARVDQARQGRDALMMQRSMMALASPVDGTVIDIVIHPGEVAAPGATMLTVAELGEVTLTVYVPETRIGQVWVGQPVQVAVDSFPGQVFEGRVSRISDQAEFTPRNVATQEERVNLVFAVEVRIPNADGALKPGMPADAVFGE